MYHFRSLYHVLPEKTLSKSTVPLRFLLYIARFLLRLLPSPRSEATTIAHTRCQDLRIWHASFSLRLRCSSSLSSSPCSSVTANRVPLLFLWFNTKRRSTTAGGERPAQMARRPRRRHRRWQELHRDRCFRPSWRVGF